MTLLVGHVLLIAVLYIVATSVVVTASSVTIYAASSVDSTYGIKGKVLPDKADEVCISSKDRVAMLLNGDRSRNTGRLCPNDGGSASNSDDSNEANDSLLKDSSLNLTIYASLPAYAPNLASILTWAVIGFLTDAAAGEYQIRSLSETNTNQTSQLDSSDEYAARLDHLRTFPTDIFHNATVRWWKYEFIFACYWGNGPHGMFNGRNDPTGSPIRDREFLRVKVAPDLQGYMEQGIESLSTKAFMQASNGTLAISLENPHNSTDPFQRNQTYQSSTVPPNEVDSLIIEPQWGWRQNLGLFICVSTISVTLALTYMASDRKRRRTRKEIWGNLGTEEGVDALLETAWKVQGDRMQVYNKGRWGYRDDDSIFMGGFQHGDAANTTGSVVDPQPETEEFLPTPTAY